MSNQQMVQASKVLFSRRFLICLAISLFVLKVPACMCLYSRAATATAIQGTVAEAKSVIPHPHSATTTATPETTTSISTVMSFATVVTCLSLSWPCPSYAISSQPLSPISSLPSIISYHSSSVSPYHASSTTEAHLSYITEARPSTNNGLTSASITSKFLPSFNKPLPIMTRFYATPRNNQPLISSSYFLSGDVSSPTTLIRKVSYGLKC